MTISGTNVNERTFSLPCGKIVRMVGNGWQPRSRHISLIDAESGKILSIDGLDNIEYLFKEIAIFIGEEKKDKYK